MMPWPATRLVFAMAAVGVAMAGCGDLFPDHRFTPDGANGDAALDATPDANDPPDAAAEAEVTVTWTMLRNAQPATCADLGLAAPEVTLEFMAQGAPVRNVRLACAAQNSTVTVPNGQYELVVSLAPGNRPDTPGVVYVRENLAVSGAATTRPVVLRQGEIAWSWSAADFAGCSDPNANLTISLDGLPSASALCALELVAGRAPVGMREVDVAISGTSPSTHVVPINVPPKGGTVTMQPTP